MESIKICANNLKHETIVLDIKSMIEKDGDLIMTLNKQYEEWHEQQQRNKYNKCCVSFDDVISLKRYVTDEQTNSLSLVSEYKSNISDISVVDNYFQITLKAPEDLRLHVKTIEEGEDFYRIVLFSESKLYVQDMFILSGASFYGKDINTGEKYDLFNVEDVYMHETNTNLPLEQKLALFSRELQKVYNECNTGDVIIVEPDYYYIPSYLVRNSIFVSKENVGGLEIFSNYIYAPFNEFYYRDEDGGCYLWEEFNDYDTIGSGITEIGGVECEYFPKEREIDINTVSTVVNDRFYYRTNIGFEENVDYRHLYQEENLTNLFTNKVKEMVVEQAPVIDMEKVKVSPFLNEEKSASQLVFNLHFRSRVIADETEGNMDVSWRYSPNASGYWNTIKDYTDIDSSEEKEKSDLLYYLNFTDEDIKNQKSKLKKSFLRLSFYDSTDPLMQKLLYYSTVFVDTGELFGKYVKARQTLIKSGVTEPNVAKLSTECGDKCRLDTRFIIRDEFYTEKSSEGFNIYYFPSDILAEKTGKTIYMKVEFNHAGYGRTIPFITTNGLGEVDEVTLKEVKDRLYIPLVMKYINISEQGQDYRYVYEVDNCGNVVDIDEENSAIIFNLFEPVIGPSEK